MRDYLVYITFRLIELPMRILPLRFVLFLGRRLGDIMYSLDLRHRSIAYSNIKQALDGGMPCRERKKLTRKFYRCFGQNIVEVFLIPRINKQYFNKYIEIEGKEYIDQAFSKGNGVIFAGIHAGSWELSNVICSSIGFPFNVLVRGQENRLLNSLLNQYRKQKGCKIIERKNKTRQLIEALKNNESIGITVDQGGKTGIPVKFFGKEASMSVGAIRLALKYDAVILPAFYTRLDGPYHRVIIQPPFKITRTGDKDKDVRENLQRLMVLFEGLIKDYPYEYLWTYKIWKYSLKREIVILSDGKAGHVRQSEALLDIIKRLYALRGVEVDASTIELKFSGPLGRKLMALSSLLSGRYGCQGCLWCLRNFLTKDTYEPLLRIKPDIIISCGSSLATVNYVLARENSAKSIVIMKPSLFAARRFELVIMPWHDWIRKRNNIVFTDTALNSIDKGYLDICAKAISPLVKARGTFTLGLLIGGNSKSFVLDENAISEVIVSIKKSLEKNDGRLIISTSRRTPPEIEGLIERELGAYARTGLLVVANKKNHPQAVGGILGLSDIVIVSPESVSMISEAVASGKYVITFHNEGLPSKHIMFLENLLAKRLIYVSESDKLPGLIDEILSRRPEIQTTDDKEKVSRALEKVL